MKQLLLIISLVLCTSVSSPRSYFTPPCIAEDNGGTVIAELDYIELGFTMLLQLEGFTPKRKHDVNADRYGYGTVATGETISEPEARRRARDRYLREVGKLLELYPYLTDQQLAALASARYNLGSFGPRLRRAIRSYNSCQIADALALYVKSAGEYSRGVDNRRTKEISFLLDKNPFHAI